MPKRVVIVDDDVAILDAVSFLLRDAGYDVRTCTDGNYLDNITEFKPDLILLDLLLSGTDGRSVVTQLRRHHITRHTPVIIMSAHTVHGDEALASGAQEFLPKPFDIEDLLALVKKYAPDSNTFGSASS